MGVCVNDMDMPKECGECRWFRMHGSTCTEPSYYVDSRCELVASGQDWYGEDVMGGWIGEDIDPDDKMGYYYYHHCVEVGTRAKQCPLTEVPSHGRLIDADALIEDLERQCKEVFRIDAVSPDDYWITRNEAYNEALWENWVESFGEYLKTRPTIIEAEEET